MQIKIDLNVVDKYKVERNKNIKQDVLKLLQFLEWKEESHDKKTNLYTFQLENPRQIKGIFETDTTEQELTIPKPNSTEKGISIYLDEYSIGFISQTDLLFDYLYLIYDYSFDSIYCDIILYS